MFSDIHQLFVVYGVLEVGGDVVVGYLEIKYMFADIIFLYSDDDKIREKY